MELLLDKCVMRFLAAMGARGWDLTSHMVCLCVCAHTSACLGREDKDWKRKQQWGMRQGERFE